MRKSEREREREREREKHLGQTKTITHTPQPKDITAWAEVGKRGAENASDLSSLKKEP